MAHELKVQEKDRRFEHGEESDNQIIQGSEGRIQVARSHQEDEQ
jgi:hypothetical protein